MRCLAHRFAAMRVSDYGPLADIKTTRSKMSAFGGKADVPIHGPNVRHQA
jgi:hypothetical protein